MECGSEASAPLKLTLQHSKGSGRAAPLAHSVGEGLGVRVKKRAHLAHNELKRCTLIIPIARAEFTIAPLLKVPPASRGEPRGARLLGSPCVQGEP